MTSGGNIVHFPERAQIDEEAARWVVRHEDGPLSVADTAAFDAWRQASPLHQDAFNRLNIHWSGLGSLRRDAAGDAPVPVRTRPVIWAAAGLAAAALAAVVVLVSPFGQSGDSMLADASVGLYETAIGDQEQIALEDGSVVTLNTASQVEVRFTDDERAVRLLEGEAFFDVATDVDRPFRVYAGKGVAAALGTAFSVRLQNDGIELVVSEGKVSYANLAERVEPIAFVGAGQAATFTDRIQRIETVDVAVVDRKLAWTAGRLVFEGDPLSSVVADISRYTDVVIEIADTGLADMRVGGVFEVGEVERMLDELESGFGLRVDRVNASLVRISAAAQ